MVHSILPHLAESRRGRAQSLVAMSKGEGAGGKSLPIGEGVLAGDQCRGHHLLYMSVLEAPTKGCVQEERERHHLACYHFPGQPGCVGSHARCLGPVHVAPECVHATGHHEGGTVWLPLQKCHGPWCCDASDGVQGH